MLETAAALPTPADAPKEPEGAQDVGLTREAIAADLANEDLAAQAARAARPLIRRIQRENLAALTGRG